MRAVSTIFVPRTFHMKVTPMSIDTEIDDLGWPWMALIHSPQSKKYIVNIQQLQRNVRHLCIMQSTGKLKLGYTQWPLASPAMGHWGTCPPPRLPASYFGDQPQKF